ncbi:MAG: hypothetical protein KKA54_00895 [Proteobacteria bacterium]|nr:hypothetical protein [Pseudomonadota bacterium]
MRKNITIILFFAQGLFLFAPFVNAGVYTNTIQFDPNEGIFWNYMWHQCVSDLPEGEHVDSVQVQLRAKVFSSGFYPPALLISDINVFYASDPDQRVGYLALRNYFYNYNYSLTPIQMEWLANDRCAYFDMLSNGGTYYLEYCKLTVSTSIPPCLGDFDQDDDVDLDDLLTFADYFGRGDCIGDCLGDFTDDGDVDGADLSSFIFEFGRIDCPQ